MLKVNDCVALANEVLTGDFLGVINIYNLQDKSKPESSAKKVLGLTYPTISIKQVLSAIDEKLTRKKHHGAYIFTGGYGTGKSHTLLFLYHFLTNKIQRQTWLSKWQLKFKFSDTVKVITSHLRADDPNFLWEDIYEKLGKKKFLSEVKDHPTAEQIKFLTSEPVVIILDEIEDWFENFWNSDISRRNRNLNFLTTLSEVASESESELIFIGALYGRKQEILAKLSRTKPFLKDLAQAEDKNKIILFRLFKEVDSSKAKKVVEQYTKHYTAHHDRIKTVMPSIDDYRKELINTFPIHPQLMDILFQNYSSSKNYQNTRGMLYLLSSVVKESYQNESLILTSAVNPEIDEIYDDLFQLEPSLIAKCLEDIRRTKTINGSLAKGILTTVFLYSLSGARAGCEPGHIYLGNLKPEININDIETTLRNLVEYYAWFLWSVDGKYVLRNEEKLPVSINFRAERILKEEGPQSALSKLVDLIRKEFGGREVYVWPVEDLPDSRYVKYAVSLQHLLEDEIKERIYKGREWRNTLIYFQPRVPVDLTERQDILLKCQRILVCETMEKEIQKDKLSQLKEIKGREEEEVLNIIKGNYGQWMKPGGKQEKILFRPIEIDLSYDDVTKKIKDSYGGEVIEDEIISLISEQKETGITVGDIKTKFFKQIGYPIILENRSLIDSLMNLCQNRKIIMERGKTIYTAENLPLDINDDFVIFIADTYTKPPEPKVKKPEIYVIPTDRDTIASPTTVEPAEEIRTVSIETGPHATSFNLQNDVEGKLLQDDVIKSISVVISGKGLDQVQFLEEISQAVGSGALYLDTEISIQFSEGINKTQLLKILEKFPNPVQGSIQIRINIEREKGEAPRKAWDQYIEKFK